MKAVIVDLRRLTMAIFVLATVSIAASATHAPHLAELLSGMHAPAHDQATLSHADSLSGPRLATADMSLEEVWCEVVGVAPPSPHPLVLQVGATALLARTVVLVAQRVWAPDSRTKPPPLVGARLRATLQVFRN